MLHRRNDLQRKRSWKAWSTLKEILRKLAKLRFVGEFSLDPLNGTLVRPRALVNLFLLDAGTPTIFCQDERLLARQLTKKFLFGLKTNFQGELAIIEGPIKRRPGAGRYFVHIRRGDYTCWPSRETPAALPASWYFENMARIRESDNDAHFFVLSDDTEFASTLFSGQSDVFVTQTSPETALTLMAECDGGVLSASSFSWWGAALASERGAKGPFYAPKHWLNWRFANCWDPPALEKTSFLEWCQVPE